MERKLARWQRCQRHPSSFSLGRGESIKPEVLVATGNLIKRVVSSKSDDANITAWYVPM
jgi:hypothetical protein